MKKQDPIALQFCVAVDGLGHHHLRGDQAAVGLGEEGDGHRARASVAEDGQKMILPGVDAGTLCRPEY